MQPPCASPADAMLPASLSALSLDAPPLFIDLLALPRPLVLAIFALLPVDTRLRCVEVNRAWRTLLADTSLWACVNLSVESGLIRFSVPLLRAAVAKAGGQLRALDITGQALGESPHCRLLHEIVAANAATLMELRMNITNLWCAKGVGALLEAAPKLQLLETCMDIDRDHQLARDRQLARAVFCKEPPFRALRLRGLASEIRFDTTADVVEFCSVLRGHASLEKLILSGAALSTAAAMGAVVDACIALRLHTLRLCYCRIVPAALPELTRLVAAGVLRELDVNNWGDVVFGDTDESTRLFVAAVRASALTSLKFHGVVIYNVARAQHQQLGRGVWRCARIHAAVCRRCPSVSLDEPESLWRRKLECRRGRRFHQRTSTVKGVAYLPLRFIADIEG